MTLGSHQTTIGKSQVHITPKWIIERLGPFDLDPCANDPQPWPCAGESYALPDDGLSHPWHGFVWLNPPFARYGIAHWIQRLCHHGSGIALLHARTETDWFEVARPRLPLEGPKIIPKQESWAEMWERPYYPAHKTLDRE